MNDTKNVTEPAPQTPQRVEARSAKDPAIRLFIMAAMLIAFGLWCYMERDKYDPPAAWDLKHINEVAKYALNAYGMYAFTPPGVLLAAWSVLFLRRRLVADQDGIGYVGKKKIPWNAVTSLDAKELKSKGILYLHHGEDSVLKLDGWKLTNFRDLVALVERKSPENA